MRKILLMLCLLLGHCIAIVAAEYTIDATTLNSPASEGPASFKNGLTITNGGGKTLSKYGSTGYLKFSNGVQYTVKGIPSGETVTSVVFYGFPHDAGNQCYIAEFNGVNEDPSKADFSDGTVDAPKDYNFQGWDITKGSFTFTVRAHETCMWIKITTTTDKMLKFEKPSYTFDLTDPTANDHMPVPENTTGTTKITYESSNTDVAACMGGGTPRLKSPGTTTITAKAGDKTASYTLTVTAPGASYALTSNAFEVYSTGVLGKSFDLDGLNFTFGGKDEKPVAMAQSDLGVGVICLDYNGYSFFNNDLNGPMGSYIVLTTTKAGTLNVRGNFVSSSSDGWTHVWRKSDGKQVNSFTAGNGYQSVKLEANTTYYLSSWKDKGIPTFYLKAISYTPDDATSANKTYGKATLNNGEACYWPAKKGQKITIYGHFSNNSDGRKFNITNVTDMNGNDVTTDNVTKSVSYLVKEDGNVELTNKSGMPLVITSAVLENSTPSLTFAKGATPSVGVNETSFTNAVNNAPAASQVTYAITANINVSASIDPNTGTLTSLKFNDGASSGSITVTATSTAVGYYNQGTGSYTLNILNLYFAKPNDQITLDISGAASYEQKVIGAPDDVIPTYSFKVTSGNPTVYLDQEEGLPDYNLTIKGTGTIVVTATCGTASASYTLIVSGLTFADVSPSISVDDESKGFTQQPEDNTVSVSNWEILKKSDGITSADIDAKGNVTNIKGHGIIVVRATTGDNVSAGYVLTVADRAKDDHELVWDFATSGKLPDDFSAATGDATGAGHKYKVKDLLDTEIGWTTKYEGVTYDKGHNPTAYNRFIYTCDQPVDGDNALYIPATEGLQFTCNANTFGLNNSKEKEKNNDRHVSFKGNNTHDNVLTIPQLKQGDYVTIWWNPYSSGNDAGNGNAGSTFRVDNATDLTGKPITNSFSTTSIQAFSKDNVPRGQVTFRARYNGDMNFYIQDNGWNNIYKIRVSRKYSTDLRLSDASQGVNAANNNNFVLVGDTVRFKGDAGHTHSQSARYPQYTVQPIGNFTGNNVEVTTPSWNSGKDGKGGVTYYDLKLKVNGGTGNILVTQDICYGADKYVLDRSETYLAVGQRKQQTYPYTWDFTSYNMDKASDKTVDHLSSTKADDYGSWSNNALNVYKSVASPSGLPGYNVDKPLFANGSQLTYGTTTIRETEGLGVTLPGTGEAYNGKVSLDGNSLSFANGSTLTIPNVGEDMYVFVKANNAPTVTNATQATPDNVSLPQSGMYVYKVSNAGDVALSFPDNTEVEKIGVTNIFKTISGEATSESRDRAIDYSQTGVFTNMGVKAYIATNYSDKSDAADMGTLTLNEVTAVPASTGLLLYKDIADGQTNDTQTSFPLFVPAVNIMPTTEQGMLKPHVVAGNVDGSDANTLRYVFTNKYYHHGSSEPQTSDDYLFYRVDQSGNLAANKAYLELPRSQTAKGFVVMSFDGGTTAIDAPDASASKASAESEDNVYYTLQGVRVNGRPTRPGVYINNGKKIIIR